MSTRQSSRQKAARRQRGEQQPPAPQAAQPSAANHQQQSPPQDKPPSPPIPAPPLEQQQPPEADRPPPIQRHSRPTISHHPPPQIDPQLHVPPQQPLPEPQYLPPPPPVVSPVDAIPAGDPYESSQPLPHHLTYYPPSALLPPGPNQEPAFPEDEGTSLQPSGNLDSLADGNGGPGSRPPYPYSTIIRYAIEGSPRGMLTLAEIYDVVVARFPYFNTAGPGWKNSIRHNLSLNRLFVKKARAITEPGKGAYWTINRGVEAGPKRTRKRKPRGKKALEAAAAAASGEGGAPVGSSAQTHSSNDQQDSGEFDEDDEYGDPDDENAEDYEDEEIEPDEEYQPATRPKRRKTDPQQQQVPPPPTHSRPPASSGRRKSGQYDQASTGPNQYAAYPYPGVHHPPPGRDPGYNSYPSYDLHYDGGHLHAQPPVSHLDGTEIDPALMDRPGTQSSTASKSPSVSHEIPPYPPSVDGHYQYGGHYAPAHHPHSRNASQQYRLRAAALTSTAGSTESSPVMANATTSQPPTPHYGSVPMEYSGGGYPPTPPAAQATAQPGPSSGPPRTRRDAQGYRQPYAPHGTRPPPPPIAAYPAGDQQHMRNGAVAHSYNGDHQEQVYYSNTHSHRVPKGRP